MLTLKLLLVPTFLLLVSLASKRWGPSVAGWLGGLPVVTGPILFFIGIERGEAFASSAASASLSAVFAAVVFSVAYSHAAQFMSWIRALLLALPAWGIAAFFLSLLPSSVALSLVVACFTLLVAPWFFPITKVLPGRYAISTIELFCRMLSGTVLTVGVTVAADRLGSHWSGLLAVFPSVSIVLAVFSHRTHGPLFVAALLRSMAIGLYSFAAFCFALSCALFHVGIVTASGIAVGLAITVQSVTKNLLR